MDTRVMFSSALMFPAPPVPEARPSQSTPDFAAVLQQSYRPADRGDSTRSSALPASPTDRSEARPQVDNAPPARDRAPRSDESSHTSSTTSDPTQAEPASQQAQSTPAKPREAKQQQDDPTKDAPTTDAPAPAASNQQPQPPVLLAMAAMFTQVPGQVGSAAQGAAETVSAGLTRVPVAAKPAVAVAQAGGGNQPAVTVAAVAAKALPQGQLQAPPQLQGQVPTQAPAQVQPQVQPLVQLKVGPQLQPQTQVPVVDGGAMMISGAKPSAVAVKGPTFQDLVQLVQGAGRAAGPASPGMQPTIDPTTSTLLVTGGSNAANVLVSEQGVTVAQPLLRAIDPVDVTAQVAKSLRVNLTQGASEVRLKLQPEHLGDLMLKLVVNGQNVQAHAVVSSQGVQQALEGQLAQLRRQLADTGLNLTDFSVSVGGQGESAGQTFQDSRQGRQQSGAWSAPDRADKDQSSAALRSGNTAVRWTRLDTRA